MALEEYNYSFNLNTGSEFCVNFSMSNHIRIFLLKYLTQLIWPLIPLFLNNDETSHSKTIESGTYNNRGLEMWSRYIKEEEKVE